MTREDMREVYLYILNMHIMNRIRRVQRGASEQQ